ncbi:MAG: hypothetical protein DRQ78_10525, partial [Epsilonproteobacteria bacterium]
MAVKNFLYVDDSGDYTEGLAEGNFVQRICEVSASVNDLVVESDSVADAVDTIINNNDTRSVIGIIIEKIDDTHAYILTKGTVSASSVTKTQNVFLSSSGTLNDIAPTSGYFHILGTAVENNLVDFDPINTKILIYNEGYSKNSFVTTWRTSAVNETITLPLVSTFAYDFDVDWGDGTSDTINSYNRAEITHKYDDAGDYNVVIVGVMETWRLINNTQIIDIKQWGDIGLTSCYQMFYGCYNMACSATDAPNFTDVTDTQYMFSSCSSIISLDFSTCDISNITHMNYMFQYCSGLETLNLSNWDITSVTAVTNILDHINPNVNYICESGVIDTVLFFPNNMKTCNIANTVLIGDM